MKLRNKLILSCAALAAVATTAVSTTFAWYTANDTVTAGGISATTNDAGSDLLMIADGLERTGAGTEQSPYAYGYKALGSLKWGTSVETVTFDPNTKLMPLAYNSNHALVDIVEDVDAESETKGKMITSTSTSDAEAGFLRFVLYLKNGGTAAKTVVMTLTNLTNTTAAALPTKSILNSADTYTYFGSANTTSETSYQVNALRVAALDVETTAITEGVEADALSNETVYSLASALGTYTNASSSVAFADTLSASTYKSWNAHSYYNAIMEKDLNTSDASNANTATFNGLGASNGVDFPVQVPAAATSNDFIKLEFKVFLNGWDQACFDACQGQNFTFGLKFQIKAGQ